MNLSNWIISVVLFIISSNSFFFLNIFGKIIVFGGSLGWEVKWKNMDVNLVVSLCFRVVFCYILNYNFSWEFIILFLVSLCWYVFLELVIKCSYVGLWILVILKFMYRENYVFGNVVWFFY